MYFHLKFNYKFILFYLIFVDCILGIKAKAPHTSITDFIITLSNVFSY